MRAFVARLCPVLVVCVLHVASSTARAQDAPSDCGPAATLKPGEELSTPPPDEVQAEKDLLASMRAQLKGQSGPVILRDQHPKHHGCVRATFTVVEGLPEHLAVGIFRRPRTYDAVIRFSNGGSVVDNVPDARGMAIKVIGVEGPSLIEGAADAGSQDFVLIAHPVFFATDPANLRDFFASLPVHGEAVKAKDTAKADDIKKRFAKQFAIAAAMRELGTPSPLELSFFSETPYRLGDKAVKYVVQPGPSNKSGLPPITKDSGVNALREAMIAHLTTGEKSATFSFGVNVQTDPVENPVEDPTVLWKSDPVTLATITIPAQEFARDDQLTFCEHLSFTPWHAQEAHRPIGGINRVRKRIYQETSTLRREANHVERKEPTKADLDRLFKVEPAGQ